MRGYYEEGMHDEYNEETLRLREEILKDVTGESDQFPEPDEDAIAEANERAGELRQAELNRARERWEQLARDIAAAFTADINDFTYNTERVLAIISKHKSDRRREQKLEEALREVRAAFFEDARSGGKLKYFDNKLHSWIPGGRAESVIKIIDEALTCPS